MFIWKSEPTRNANPDKYSYSGHGTGFDYRSLFSIPDLIGVDISSSIDIDNKNKDILSLAKGRTPGLDNTALTAEAEYSIDFAWSQRIFCLAFIIMEAKNFLFVKAIKTYQLKAKNSETKP